MIVIFSGLLLLLANSNSIYRSSCSLWALGALSNHSLRQVLVKLANGIIHTASASITIKLPNPVCSLVFHLIPVSFLLNSCFMPVSFPFQYRLIQPFLFDILSLVCTHRLTGSRNFACWHAVTTATC